MRSLAQRLTFGVARPCGPPALNASCFPSPEEHGTPSVLTSQVGWMQGAAGIAGALLHYDAHQFGGGGGRAHWPDEPWLDVLPPPHYWVAVGADP
jgi:hypothetical protein